MTIKTAVEGGVRFYPDKPVTAAYCSCGARLSRYRSPGETKCWTCGDKDREARRRCE